MNHPKKTKVTGLVFAFLKGTFDLIRSEPELIKPLERSSLVLSSIKSVAKGRYYYKSEMKLFYEGPLRIQSTISLKAETGSVWL